MCAPVQDPAAQMKPVASILPGERLHDDGGCWVVLSVPGRPLLTVGGQIDSFTSYPLARALDNVWRTAPASVAIDLSRVSFCGACGLRLLVQTSHTASRHAIPLTLHAPRPHLARLLDLVGLAGHVVDVPARDGGVGQQRAFGRRPAA